MQHLFRVIRSCSITFLLLLPLLVSAQQGENHSEELRVIRSEGHNISATRVEIAAVKQLGIPFNHSEVHFVSYFGGEPPSKIRYAIDSTFVVPLDADWLEVSDDLGWSGLDAELSIPIQTTTCVDYVGGNCSVATSMTPVTIHLSGLAVDDVIWDGATFERHARFTGTVVVGSRTFVFNGVWGSNFADQYTPDSW